MSEIHFEDKVEVECEYANRGLDAIPARTCDVEVWIGNEKVAHSYAHPPVGMIPSGGDGTKPERFIFEWTPTQVGTLPVRFDLDPFGRLDEVNELNNTWTGEVRVHP